MALMATLIGINYSIDSVGVALPDIDPAEPKFLKSVAGGGSEAKFAPVNARVCHRSFSSIHTCDS